MKAKRMSGRDQKKRGVVAAPESSTPERTGWSRDAAVVCRADLRVSADLARRVKNRTLALLGGSLASRLN
jgi:class 3 adenylate cyclase